MAPGLVSTFIWLSISTLQWYLVFILCYYSVLTCFLLCASPFCSVPTRFISYYVRNFAGSVHLFSLNQQLKKRNEIKQHKKIRIIKLSYLKR